MARRTAYEIVDWEEHFEVAQTKRNRHHKHSWVAMPNKHDGKGYRRLAKRKDFLSVFGAWCLIAEVASKCPKRGLLADSDGPLCTEDIAIKTGASEAEMDAALKVLCSKAIGWMRSVHYSVHDLTAVRPQSDPDTPTRQDQTEQYNTEPNNTVQGPHEIKISSCDDCYDRSIPPIAIALAVTGEKHSGRAANSFSKEYGRVGDSGFRDAVARTFKDLKKGGINKPGALLNSKLQLLPDVR